jgi:hypothetical protein
VDPEQIARNDAIFREANEHIENAAQSLGQTGRIPFICECAEPSCRELVQLTLEEYERVREEPTRFFLAPGHEGVAPKECRVVERAPGHVVVEKVGRAADVALQLDARTD